MSDEELGVLEEIRQEVQKLPEPDRIKVEVAARVLRRFVTEQGPWGRLALGLVGAEVAAAAEEDGE